MMTHIQFLSQLGCHYNIDCLVEKPCTFVAQHGLKEYGSFAERRSRAAVCLSIGDKTENTNTLLKETLVQFGALCLEAIHLQHAVKTQTMVALFIWWNISCWQIHDTDKALFFSLQLVTEESVTKPPQHLTEKKQSLMKMSHSASGVSCSTPSLHCLSGFKSY